MRLLGDEIEGRDQPGAVVGLTRVGGVLDDLPEGGVNGTAPVGGIQLLLMMLNMIV